MDILRGYIGTQNCSNKDILNIETNNQQDVSEFTHIVLEWVEDAFKADSESNGTDSNCAMQTDDQAEKEINEEKDAEPKNENPMAKLFYGKVIREGRINGDAFLRQENFGQWPLQVNTCSNLHESLEKSLAHEQFDASNSSGTNGESQSLKSGQELWFDKLPPVLFLELSRFQYNMERKTAEKIHNRLEFPQRIFMDRYVSLNKTVTKMKRDQVRALKERRAILKSRLDKFTQYGQEASGISLPVILQRTLDFAQTPFAKKEVSMAALAASSLMQVDSPVSSPKMTPASSLSNLACQFDNSASAALPEADEAMDVEMTGEVGKEVDMNGCDSVTKPVENILDERAVVDPAPRYVTEAELRLLQVTYSF